MNKKAVNNIQNLPPQKNCHVFIVFTVKMELWLTQKKK